MIIAKSLKKQFRTDRGQIVDALNDVNFDVADGEFFVLLGPSGSGKTTTLRAVAGLETPDSGLLQVGEQQVFSSDDGVNTPSEERPVAMVFQSYALWPHMDVTKNISFPLRHGVRRVPQAEAERRIASVAETLELTPYLKRPISQLSGGQQQRVALARALALEPSVLLMDEPLSNLDAKLRAQLRVELKNLTMSLGITTLYVTHDQVEAMVMGDRIAVMNHGEIVELGTPRDLYKRPKSEFVAKFLGEMNFIPGTVTADASGKTAVDTPIGAISVNAQTQHPVGSSVKVGFRPEDIRLDQTSDSITFEATIRRVYYLGDVISCDFEINNSIVAAQLPNSINLREGDRVTFSIERENFSLFSQASAEQ